MAIVLACGGTGGHIMPALAVAEALENAGLRREEILFIGTGKEIETNLIGRTGFRLESVSFVPVSGKGIKGLFGLIVALPQALIKVIRLYRLVKPKVVVGFGGYPSFVPIVAARLLGIPALLHEQNVKVGLANKVLSLLVNEIFAIHGARGFWSSRQLRYLSNPVRRSISEIPAWQPPQDGQPFVLLVLGGSQGAVTLNTAVLQMATAIKGRSVKIIHQAGERDLERVTKSYAKLGMNEVRVFAFADDVADCYCRSHLIICRAGAMTVAEVSAAGRPAIFVPLAIAGGHQAENVAHLVNNGAALMIEQAPGFEQALCETVCQLLDSPNRLEELTRNLSTHCGSGTQSSAEIMAERVLSYSLAG